jgi:hypothetical protein
VPEEPATDTSTSTTTTTDTSTSEGGTTDGPLNDKMADSGKLFGDLYKILRYTGGETKQVPDGDGSDVPQTLENGPTAFGGEPILSGGYGVYAEEVTDSDGDVVGYIVKVSNFLSQCVQPVADYEKWGDISSVSGQPSNTLPLIMTYDATWGRTECIVGEIKEGESITVDSEGNLVIPIDEYFIEPMGEWKGVTYCEGVLWTDLVEEVSFGRLNLSRSPEAVLQAAFDEAITAINAADSVAIDPAGRLLLTTTVYSETGPEYVDTDNDAILDTCVVPEIETVVKAIDSPLENLALYVKLMTDGHLITPGDQRAPIDRSVSGGIPLWKMLELTDGPSSDLRPTLSKEKLEMLSAPTALSALVDVTPVDYVTYYDCYKTVETVKTETVCTDPDVEYRELQAVAVTECPEGETCIGGVSYGITTADGSPPEADDFPFAAAFLSAAADKTGEISTDMVVYINSILGINKVVGTSEDGETDYSEDPEYFDYSLVSGYNRGSVLGTRGSARYLEESVTADTWVDKQIGVDKIPDSPLSKFDKLGLNPQDPNDEKPDYLPNLQLATEDILGFTQMADDDLSVIEFIHTYQIPGLR